MTAQMTTQTVRAAEAVTALNAQCITIAQDISRGLQLLYDNLLAGVDHETLKGQIRDLNHAQRNALQGLPLCILEALTPQD